MMFHIDAFPVSRPRFLILKETGNQVKMFPSSSWSRTSPFHGGNRGSNPLGNANSKSIRDVFLEIPPLSSKVFP